MSQSRKTGVKSQLGALQQAIDVAYWWQQELRDNISADRHSPYKHQDGDLEKVKLTLANMMDLFMNEVDSLKRDLYVDFGETQKIIAGDINQLRADVTQIELKLSVVEKSKLRAPEGRGLENRVEALEKHLAEGTRIREVTRSTASM